MLENIDQDELRALNERVESLRERARQASDLAKQLSDRVGAAEAASLQAIDALRSSNKAMGRSISAEAIAGKVRERMDRRLDGTESLVQDLRARLEGLPDKVREAGSPDRIAELERRISAFRAQVKAAGTDLDSYARDTVIAEVFQPRLVKIVGASEALDEKADDTINAVAAHLEAWGEDLKAAAIKIRESQETWAEQLDASWDRRSASFADHVSGRFEELHAKGEGLAERVEEVVTRITGSMEDLSKIRQDLGSLTSQTGGGLELVTSILDDVVGIFEAVE